MLLHVFGHVEPYHRVAFAENGLGEGAAQKIVEACHIRDGRRVSGLGYMQGPRLVEAIKSHMTAKEDGQ